jgi:NAD(P)-dependent dehydrogenase (short-subunit alcohol dehydrogenase family)
MDIPWPKAAEPSHLEAAAAKLWRHNNLPASRSDAITRKQEEIMKGLSGKVAIVTGGGQGIGRAITLRLAEEGCKVAIFDIKPEAGQETAKLAPPSSISVYAVDVGDRASVDQAVAKVEAEIGPIWALVNNAGWDRPMPFLKTDKDLWDKIIRINLYGPHAPCDCAIDGGARRRPYYQYRVGCCPRRHQRRGGLFGLQGRSDLVHQIDRPRTCSQERLA